MLSWIKPALFIALIFAQDAVLAAKPFHGEHERISHRALLDASKVLGVRGEGNPYINIVQGLFRSERGNIVHYLSNVPCDVVQTLETDADEAETFVNQLKAGQVPSIIQDLPQEAVQEFKDVINIALSLPTEILDAVESAATDAANIFNDIEDGSIIQDLEKIPGIIVSDITSGWADFTSELTGAWDDVTSGIECFFGHCPQSTAVGSCPAAAAATTTNQGAAATTTSYGAAATTTNQGAAATSTNQGAAATTTSQGSTAATTSRKAAASTTSRGAAATPHTAAQSATQSPTQPTGATSLASPQSNWAGLGFLITAAVAVFACALCL